ncbi:hypothetical protein XENOCAPTIV_024414 [Xenoophorus captivus]|uniref:Uncharacterized protein n=1 Tax=Xenoophorus captivus TaxID=1517983 RepID=A0ABV0QNV5_9TELE
MTSLTTSSQRSSSSYRSSSRYSTSSCYRSDGSLNGSLACAPLILALIEIAFYEVTKVLDDGSVSNTFTHKSLFPEDMDPLSVSGTLDLDGTLWVTVRRIVELNGPEPLGVPTYTSEAHL